MLFNAETATARIPMGFLAASDGEGGQAVKTVNASSVVEWRGVLALPCRNSAACTVFAASTRELLVRGMSASETREDCDGFDSRCMKQHQKDPTHSCLSRVYLISFVFAATQQRNCIER